MDQKSEWPHAVAEVDHDHAMMMRQLIAPVEGCRSGPGSAGIVGNGGISQSAGGNDTRVYAERDRGRMMENVVARSWVSFPAPSARSIHPANMLLKAIPKRLIMKSAPSVFASYWWNLHLPEHPWNRMRRNPIGSSASTTRRVPT
jgi:hypothetical protein